MTDTSKESVEKALRRLFSQPKSVELFVDVQDIARSLLRERDDAKAEVQQLKLIAYRPKSQHEHGCLCIQCVPF